MTRLSDTLTTVEAAQAHLDALRDRQQRALDGMARAVHPAVLSAAEHLLEVAKAKAAAEAQA
ncbi:MAG: hypothetical protein JWQ89_3113 [Devosia sp.]|uniref:hypothetical protein n=1 Tax=Devosia sp. TaxID=1871048 RepID=UPI00260539B3|nr:hypothetical protein [Devosia sp.]MDB5541386.1 hypothetical protein [Devosia sp.]